MKKVGIVSIFRTGNYGGTLQAYALREAIRINGYGTPEMINYCCDAIKGKIDINYLKKAGLLHTIVAIVEKLLYYPRMKKVNAFIDSYVSGKVLRREELDALNEQYDIFLSGSDQLWNPDIQQGDFYYLLDFVKEKDKKRSYASSFGKKVLPEIYKAQYRSLLSSYKYITVREETGADIVYKLLGYQPEIVLDPALLLTAEQWESRLPDRVRSGQYIFTYRLTYSTKLTQVVVASQKVLDMPVMAVPFLLGICPKTKNYFSLSSLEWLRGIYDSNFVITDSFHGVVFSIIFSKPFYYVITSETVKERLSRLETLLKKLGLEERLVESTQECDFQKSIDYNKVHEKLDVERENALKVLKEILD